MRLNPKVVDSDAMVLTEGQLDGWRREQEDFQVGGESLIPLEKKDCSLRFYKGCIFFDFIKIRRPRSTMDLGR